jgi:uncharacterized repeat protein (TIGR01451 family)
MAAALLISIGLGSRESMAASTKSVDVTSPVPGQQITYTITIDEASDQHNGRPIYSVTVTDQILAPFTFVSVTCSLSCSANTPAVGASGLVTVTGFGADEGPFDPVLTGTITVVVAAPDSVGDSFTNQACVTAFVSPTMSDPEVCISAPEVTTVEAPTATPTDTATATPTETSTPSPTATPTNTSTPTETATVAPSSTATATSIATATATSIATATETTVAATAVPTATSNTDDPDEAALGDPATTGDVTALPNTGTQRSAGGDRETELAFAVLLGALAVGGVAFRRFQSRNLTT